MHISRLAIITNRGVKMTAKLAMSRFWLMASGYFHSFTFIQEYLGEPVRYTAPNVNSVGIDGPAVKLMFRAITNKMTAN